MSDDFDKSFKRTQRTFWTIFIVSWAVGLSVLGGIAYVAIHFLKKIW